MATKGVNKVIIVGNIGSDPESRSFPNGGTVTNISVATSETWKDKNTGQQQERTEWHRIVLQDRGAFTLGQIAAQWLKKGMKVYIEGSLRTRKYQGNDGIERYTTEIIAEQMQMLDGKKAGDDQNQQAAPRTPPQAQRQAPAAAAQTPGAPQGGFADFDADIPF